MKAKRRQRKHPVPERPLLLTDPSRESAEAMRKLIDSKLPFSLVPAEGAGPTLVTKQATYSGLEGVERYIEEKAAGSGA